MNDTPISLVTPILICKGLPGKAFVNLNTMDWTQVLGLFAGICTSSSLVPQLIKTIKEKQAGEISKVMLFILLTGVAGWIAYGLLRKDLPIIITNSLSLLLNFVMIYLGFKYGKK